MLYPIVLTATLLTISLCTLALVALYDEVIDGVGFDRRFRTSTGMIGRSGRSFGKSGLAFRGYMPSPVRTVRSLLAALPVDLAKFTLVDLGSGKGRTLLVGAEYGFAKCIGVECWEALYRTSQENLSAWRGVSESLVPVEILCDDAVTYEFPTDPLVIYLYNPFPRDVMKKVLANLRQSHNRAPRPIIIITVHPRFDSLFDESGFLRPLALAGTTTDFFKAFVAD